MLTTIIIDRVGKTNVFNLIQDKNINYTESRESHNLQSIVDNDLIEEFNEELNRIASISRALGALPHGELHPQATTLQHLDLNTKLRQIGEAFYRQFFPNSLKEFFQKVEISYLYFNVDEQLASIPFEILHDGEQFLCEKYYLGKSVKGQRLSLLEIAAKESLNMLIIADPTEDLEWARKEGEILYEHLTSRLPERKISIELFGGRAITKLNLLNAIKNKDIIHYAGHLHYNDVPSENGWLLQKNKIVRAREIQKSGAEPLLIFSNSCASARSQESDEKGVLDWYARFTSSFIRSEKTAYIGTNWEVPDSQQTLNFTLNFYDSLLQGDTIGESLRKSRKFARENFSTNDLTWASYILMGNPTTALAQDNKRMPDLMASIISPQQVIEKYPYPIAEAFLVFNKLQSNRDHNPLKAIEAMFNVFEHCIRFLATILLANYNYLKFPSSIDVKEASSKDLLDVIFKVLSAINTIKARPLAQNLPEVLNQHRDSLYKLEKWHELFQQDAISGEEEESYEITVQYLLEAFLLDIDFLRNYGLYLIHEPGYKQLSLSGVQSFHKVKEIILPTQANLTTYEELLEKTEKLIGRVVFYNPVKKIFLDLSPFMEVRITTNKDQTRVYKLNYKFDTL